MYRKTRFTVLYIWLLFISTTMLTASKLNLVHDDAELNRRTKLLPVSFANVVDDAQKAVVSVYAHKLVNVYQRRSPFSRLRNRLYGIPDEQYIQTEQKEIPQGMGSGVIVTADGYIITNNHVVTDSKGNDADEIKVKFRDGTEHEATLIGRDPQTDIAVIKINATNLMAIPITDSDQVRVGDVTFAIGHPLDVGLTVTSGIVSATERSIGITENGYEDFIQTDASINPGNSGGALIDGQGRLIGINSAILSMTGSSIGIGFAIPSNLAVYVLEQLVEHGEVRRGILGIYMSKASKDGRSRTDGVPIADVRPGFPAEKAGLLSDDIIVELNGTKIKGVRDFRLLLGKISPDKTVDIKILRDGKYLSKQIALANPADAAGELISGIYVEVRDLRKILRGSASGLLITSMDSNTPLRQKLFPGLLILEINDTPTSTISESRQLLKSGGNKLTVLDPRRQRTHTITLNLGRQ